MKCDFLFLSWIPKIGNFWIIAQKEIEALEEHKFLNKKLIKNNFFVWIDYIFFILNKLWILKDRFYYMDRLFSKIANIILKKSEANILHCWSFHCYEILKNNNYKLTIVERANASINFSYNVLKDEYKKVWLSFNVSSKHRNIVNKELKLSKYLLTCSNFAKKTYINEWFPEEKIKVLYYWVDTKQFKMKKSYFKDEKINFIFVGYDWIRKGLYYLIEARKELNKEKKFFKNKARLLIFGPNKDDLILKKLIGDTTNIKLMGKEYPVKIYEYWDVFVFPSLEDWFWLVVLEAMSSWLPVIVSQNTWASELVEDNGFIIPIKNKISLKEKIEFFVDNPHMIIKMGKKSRKIAEKYTRDNFKLKYINLLNELYNYER